MFRGRAQSRTLAAARNFVQRFGADLQRTAHLAGPVECPMALLAHNYRYQILLRTQAFDATHTTLRRVLAEFCTPAAVYLEVDVDPLQML